MNKQKLKLNQLKVDSFTTSTQQDHLQGGGSESFTWTLLLCTIRSSCDTNPGIDVID